MAGKLTMVWKVLENIFPVFLVILLGAWSDKYGKKLPMLFVVFGYILQNIGLLICDICQTSLGGWTVVIAASLFPSLTGNNPCFNMAVFSYVAEHVSLEQRAARTGIVHTIRILGVSLAYGVGGAIAVSSLSYTNIFAIALFLELSVFTLIYVGIRSHEAQNKLPLKEMFADIFSKDQLKATISVVKKARESNKRMKLLLFFAVYFCAYIPITGETTVCLLFGRYNFNWDVSEVGAFLSYRMVVSFVGELFVVSLLLKKLKISDPIIGIICCLSTIATSCFCATANSVALICFGVALGIFRGATRIIPKCVLSKITSSDELGKVYSFLGLIDTVCPMIGGFIYTTVYTNTFQVYPGIFFFVSAAFGIPQLLVYLYFLREPSTDVKQE